MKLDRLKTDFTLGGYFPRTLNDQKSTPQLAQNLNEDERWMMEALLVSMNGIGWSAPNPSVGCVIVKGGKKIADGFTQAYRHEHAERMAFRNLSKEQLQGATVYVTLEPCAHQGHQPPCVDLLLNSSVKRVVIACKDPDDRVAGRSIEALTKAKIDVTLGVLEAECSAWLFPFLKNREKINAQTKTKTVWIGKWAQTADELLANADGSSKWITGPKSREYTHWLRQKYDAILVGAGTWIQDRPSLTARDCAMPHRRNPTRLVFDPHGRLLNLSAEDQILHRESGLKIFVNASILKSATLPKEETKDGQAVEWIAIDDRDPVQSLVDEVEKCSFQSVMVEGGPTLLNLLLEKGQLDAIHQFSGTKKLNDADGRYQVKKLSFGQYFQVQTQKIDDDVLQEWIKSS